MVASLRCPDCAGDIVAPASALTACSRCHRVVFAGRDGRDPTAPLPFVDPACRDLTATAGARAIASSEAPGHQAQEAIDGHRGSMWRATSGAPAWWCADLGEVVPVRGVTLVPAMQPAIGQVVHVIESCVGGEDWSVRATLEQQMTDRAVYAVDFGDRVDARWVRIRTEASPAAIAWYEIGVFGGD
jgi:hypothetical protein